MPVLLNNRGVGSNLLLGDNGAGVDKLGVVVDDALDEALLLEESDGTASERAVDLHAVNEDRLRDELVGRDLLEDTVAGEKVSTRTQLFFCRSLESERDVIRTRSACRGRRRCWPCPSPCPSTTSSSCWRQSANEKKLAMRWQSPQSGGLVWSALLCTSRAHPPSPRR